MLRHERMWKRQPGATTCLVALPGYASAGRIRLVVGSVVVLLVTMSAQAVIIRGGDGSGNTAAPLDDPGWANVGRRGVGSAVYLGNGWVLTAAHVGAGTVQFGGEDFDARAGSAVRLHDPSNPDVLVDLMMFQIDGAPEGAESLSISSTTPAGGTDVIGIGYGRNRQEESTWWNSSWQQETGSPRYRGFEYDEGRTKRWGENDIDVGGFKVNAGWGATWALRMDFDRFGGQGGNEFQAADGDSGGGLFSFNGSEWELCGLMMAVGIYGSQPDETAVFGDYTYAVDLSRYYDQLTTVMAMPEPASVVLIATGAMMMLIRRQRRKTA
ncbi:MAG: trypsin-like serine protease [Phycisphaerae bacterium]|nr:trypsin-like serine protease [Phycisphaerae bacterium]